MKTNVESNKQRIEKKYVYIFLALFLFELLFFFLIKSNIFENMDFSIQEALQPEHSNNTISISLFLKIIYYLNKIFFPYSIIIILNNFSNIYNTFILFNILSISYYISYFLKIIFYKIIKNNNGIIYYCGDGWNLPSNEMIISVVFNLSLWNILFNEKYKKKIKTLKIIFLVIIIIFNIINLIYLAKIGYYLFSHLIFSSILGVLIYLFIFEINIIKKYNSKEFCLFVNNKFEHYMIINIVLLILAFIPYIIQRNIKNNDISECKSIEGSFYYKNKSAYITYVDDTFSLIALFFSNFFVMIGIKCELTFVFGNNIQNFEQYHFGVNIDDLNIEKDVKYSNTGSIIVTRDTEWNNTVKIKSIIRLIITFALTGACFLPYFFIKKDKDIGFSTIFLVKYFLSFSLFSFGATFFFKFIFRLFNLSNEILDSILNDQ